MRFLDTTINQPTFFDPQSAWLRHGPFAMWLVGALRPRRIVELGTHTGYSYFAFCQAVKEHHLSTNCVAVDTWQGDEHAGFYDNDVYDAVTHHNALYSDFSTLLRKTFDTARDDIEDGSIDLLHVDGRHFYNDVKADFESWIPKLSPRAIVLFHDTEVRERGFGVWKYWAEIATNRPALNFPHQHGLGVLFWGAEIQSTDADSDIARLIALLGTKDGREAVISTFVLAGEDSVRRHVFGDIDEVPPEQLPSLMANYQAQLSKKSTDNVILSDENVLLSEQIADLTQSLAQAQEEKRVLNLNFIEEKRVLNLSLMKALEIETRQRLGVTKMNTELSHARSQPWKVMGTLCAFWALTALSRATPPLPDKMTKKFGRSAHKRNPKLPFTNLPWSSPMAVSLEEVPMALTLEELREQIRASSEASLQTFLASSEQIILPAHDSPRVTVILVLWNQAALTLACLQSLAEEILVPINVIIVDNASTDHTTELLAQVQNARILRKHDNVGFLRGVNEALAEVRCGHVLLLNNDATLRRGTLDAAVQAMDSAANVGAVGGPIILPNGALQEAGSIIWRDGSCHGYGRDDAPQSGPYMFRRDVDYCSGAFLLIREGLFQQMGGFDEAYIPAYYEETDLCMRIRASGYRVIYEPRAIIDHFEFGSSTKVSTALELQRVNRRAFCEKHAVALAEDHLPASQPNILNARMRDNRKRILYIDDRVPLSDLGAGMPRTNEILQLMVDAGYFVTFLPSTSPSEDWLDTWATVPEGVEVAMDIGLTGLEAFLAARTEYYGQIFISRPHNMACLVEINRRRPELLKRVKIIYDAEAIFASRDLCKAELLGDTALHKRALRDEHDELALASIAQHVTAVNAAEAERFRSINGAVVSVLGHSLPASPTPAKFDDRKHVLFLGNLAHDDTPNADSYVWFVDKAMPHLNTVFEGSTRFLVGGRNDAASVQSRHSGRIDLLGPVEDLAALFDQSRVFVAPTRYAAGIPHKVHQAASLGVPVVATSLLARQLGWENERHLLVADSPEDFAAAVSRLFQDATLWETIRASALEKVAQECNPENFRADLMRIITQPAKLFPA
jgi:GT2 family glycosyltransferase